MDKTRLCQFLSDRPPLPLDLLSTAYDQMNLDQLLVLNHERYVAEVHQGLHEKKSERGNAKEALAGKRKMKDSCLCSNRCRQQENHG